MGNRICPLNDVDGDKRPDFALDDGCGWIWLVSGKTGKCIARVEGDKKDSRYDSITALFGDVDADGAWDLADWHGNEQRQSQLLIRSGKDLHVIRELRLPEDSHPDYGLCLSAAGDWNADGIPDLAVAGSTKSRSCILVLSGKDGTLLATCGAVPAEDRAGGTLILGPGLISAPRVGRADRILGTTREDHSVILFRKEELEHPTIVPTDMTNLESDRSFAFVGDRDGDGLPDLVLTEGHVTNDEHGESTASNKSQLFSSRTGLALTALRAGPVLLLDGLSSALVGDIDGDGARDYLITYTGFIGAVGFVYSGKSNEVLRTVDEADACCAEGCRFGVCSVDLGDVDADGVDDYAIGSNGGVDGVFPGCVSVFSGKTGRKLYSLWKSDFFKEQR
jgi:hypothetical protein